MPNEDVFLQTEYLNTKCELAISGIEWINGLSEEEKSETLLNKPYSVLVDAISFRKIREGKISITNNYDYPVPIVNIDIMKSINNNDREEILYIVAFKNLIINVESFKEYVKEIDTKLISLEIEVNKNEERISHIQGEKSRLFNFYENYSHEKVKLATDEIYRAEFEVAILQTKIDDLALLSAQLYTKKQKKE